MASSLDEKIQQLMEMGASHAQAKHALRSTSDVMEAAQQFFDGKFDNVKEDVDNDVEMGDTAASSSRQTTKRVSRLETPPDDDDEELEDDGEVEDFADYDSDGDFDTAPASGPKTGVDPYAGIFFSKDRKEEVIEVIEVPEFVMIEDKSLPLMTQGEWMKGCPEGGEQGLLFQLYSKLSNEKCDCPSGCGYSVLADKALFFAIWPKFSEYLSHLRKNIMHNCPTCSARFCLACGERVDPQKASMPSYDPLLHCADLQGVILGIGLYMVEHLYNQEAPEEEASSKKRKQSPALTATAVPDEEDESYFWGAGSTPRGKRAKGGTGYAGAQKEDTTGQQEAARMQQQQDKQFGELLRDVRMFLPSLQREGGPQTSDYLVHSTALAHLRRRFNLVASALLRNDSLSDMSDRHIVYFELFHWFEIISRHEALATMMGMPIMVVASITVKAQTSGGSSSSRPARKASSGPRERVIVYEGSAGPRELMESILSQAQAALKGLGPSPEELEEERLRGKTVEERKRMPVGHTTDSQDNKGKGKANFVVSEENVRLRTFCERIISTVAAVDRALRETKGEAFMKRLKDSLPKLSTISTIAQPSDPSRPDATAYDYVLVGETDEENRTNYVEWAQGIRFQYCDLTVPAPQASASTTAKNPSGATTTTTSNSSTPLATPTPRSTLNPLSNTSTPLTGITPSASPVPVVLPGGQSTIPDDGPPHYRHAYNNDIRLLANQDIPKRSLAIAREQGTLIGNLPVSFASSIFLRVDEVRVDVIKALIIGPEDTPYENGCFTFDIFLGPSYNQGPPNVKTMTTGGGRYRFNPNLYAEGKVCLSLLGTWSGPGWIAGKSTLLQVLVSIQSMILTDEPYLNEPGWSTSGGTPASRAYNLNTRRMTVKIAMLQNLVDPPAPFADIIRTHYRLKANYIKKQLDKWVAEDDGVAIDPSNNGRLGSGPGSSTANAVLAGLSGAGTGTGAGTGGNASLRGDVQQIKQMLDKLTANGNAAAAAAAAANDE